MAFNLQKVLKALLFASSGPLSVKDIQAVIARFHEQGSQPTLPIAPEGDPSAAVATEEAAPEEENSEELYAEVPSLVTSNQIHEAMAAIAAELKDRDEVYYLVEGANGYRLVTNPKTARWVRMLRDEPPPVRLSQAAMETLAVVAYRQPTTRGEIETIRGVSAEAGITKLLERELIQVVGRADLPGRPIQYGTTDNFLEFIGVKSLDEMPASDVLTNRQISDWLEQSSNPRQLSGRDLGLESDKVPLQPGTDDTVTITTEQDSSASKG